jgi:hypothetical protein
MKCSKWRVRLIRSSSSRMIKCDALTVTSPRPGNGDPFVSAAVLDVLDCSGAGLESDAPGALLYRAGAGIFKVYSKGQVRVSYASGAMLDHFRSLRLYGPFLSALSMEPHRVTRLDAARDDYVDAAPVVLRLRDRARTGRLALSRKAVPAEDVLSYEALSSYVPAVVTGTVYVGGRFADVRLVAYDKRDQLLKQGGADHGPWLRHELRLHGGLGVTLRDASDPTAVFYRYTSPAIFPRPAGVAEWVPRAEGFKLDPLPKLPALERAFRLMDGSPDFARLKRLIQAEPAESRAQLSRVIVARLVRADGGTPASSASVVPIAGPGSSQAVR